MELLGKIWSWFLPPPGHDPTIELMYRYRTALFGCLSFFAALALYSGLLFAWGPEVIRPVSAQAVRAQIADAKQQVSQQIADVNEKLKKISDDGDDTRKAQREDRLERVEQQLQWWRQQNCRSKGNAKNYAWQKMGDLKQKYRELTGSEWQMPTCVDIGEP